MNEMEDAKAEAKELLERYDEDRRYFRKAADEAAQKFDKVMVSLSAGAFVLSVTFLGQASPAPIAKALLVLAWIFFGMAIVAISLAFLFSQYACMKEQSNWGQFVRDMVTPGNEAEAVRPGRAGNPYWKGTEILNWLSMASFLLGLVFLVVFAATNL